MHAVFHCKICANVRVKFSDLFENAQTLRSFLASNPTHRIALFWTACRSAWADWQSYPSRTVLLSDMHCDHDTELDLDLDADMHLGEVDLYDSD